MSLVQASAQGEPTAPPGRTFERVTEVRKLAGRKTPAAIVHAFAPGGAELGIVERYASSALDAAALERLERDARAAMTLRHPNVAAVRDVWREGGELAVATEWVEGETLEELRKLGAGSSALSLEVGVRTIVDVLAALSALHGLAAGPLAHGEITAGNVVVGFDGATRLVRPYRGGIAGRVAEADWFSYAAPEVLRGGAADVRSDVFAVGALLWETLAKRKLFPKATREGRTARSIPVGKPAVPPDAAWAAPLAAVVERALANDPAARYSSAAEMAAAVRLAVRSKLAMPPRVAAAVDRLAGERILARRTANALPEPSAGARLSGRPSRPSMPPEAVRALGAMRPSSRPPTPKPGPVVMPAVPKAPPVPAVATLERPHTAPRPIAPPLKLAPPASPPPAPPGPAAVDEAPISLDDALVEPASASSAALAVAAAAPPPPARSEPTPAQPTPPATVTAPSAPRGDVPAGLERRGSNRNVVVAIALFVTVVALGAIVRVVAFGSTDKPTAAPKATSAHATPTVPATATVTATPSATATPTTSASGAPSASASAGPDDSSEAEPAASHHHHPRPRPTYDPMGI